MSTVNANSISYQFEMNLAQYFQGVTQSKSGLPPSVVFADLFEWSYLIIQSLDFNYIK